MILASRYRLRAVNERMAREGTSFGEGYGTFLEFCGGAQLWSYGDDADLLNENRALNDLEMRLVPCEGQDISAWFRAQGLDLTGVNSGKLAAFVGAAAQGAEHQGLADARSIAAALRKLAADGAPNPFSN